MPSVRAKTFVSGSIHNVIDLQRFCSQVSESKDIGERDFK